MKGRMMSFGQLRRENFELCEKAIFIGRVHCSRRNEPATFRIHFDPRKCVRHDVAENRLGRMARPPADNITAQTGLGKNVPERFAFARSACVRSRSAVLQIRLDEAVNAVLVRILARSDRIPEHRRKNRLKRREISHHASIDQILERRH